MFDIEENMIVFMADAIIILFLISFGDVEFIN